MLEKIMDMIKGLIGGASNAAGSAVDSAGNAAGGAMDAAGNVAGGAMDAAGNVAGGAMDAAGGAAGAVGDMAGGLGDMAGGAMGGVMDKVGDMAGGMGLPTELVDGINSHLSENGGSLNMPEGLVPDNVMEGLMGAVGGGGLDISKLPLDLLNNDIIQKLMGFFIK